jgi:hypothetical protein
MLILYWSGMGPVAGRLLHFAMHVRHSDNIQFAKNAPNRLSSAGW